MVIEFQLSSDSHAKQRLSDDTWSKVVGLTKSIPSPYHDNTVQPVADSRRKYCLHSRVSVNAETDAFTSVK